MTGDLTCPECGCTFTRTSRARQSFCTPEHKRRYHVLMAQRGQLLMPILLAKSELRHAKSREDRARAATYRRWVDALAAQWNIADRTAGRSADLVAKVKVDRLWSPNDLA
jgi:hypothetical protein